MRTAQCSVCKHWLQFEEKLFCGLCLLECEFVLTDRKRKQISRSHDPYKVDIEFCSNFEAREEE